MIRSGGNSLGRPVAIRSAISDPTRKSVNASAAYASAAVSTTSICEQQPYQPVLNKYHPSQKREAGVSSNRSSLDSMVSRSALSDPSQGGSSDYPLSRTLSPHASTFVASGAGGGAGGGGRGGGGGGAGAPSTSAGVSRESTSRTLNKATGGPATKTSEAELNSLVAHCVRHNKKATTTTATAAAAAADESGGGGGGGSGGENVETSSERVGASSGPAPGVIDDSLPEEIKDVLRRLTRETFSENTMLVTIERVRHVGSFGGLGGEARHNSQMMVVSKLLNDLVTRRQRTVVGTLGTKKERGYGGTKT